MIKYRVQYTNLIKNKSKQNVEVHVKPELKMVVFRSEGD